MSVTEVQARISQINSQLAMLTPAVAGFRTAGTSGTAAAGFAKALADETATIAGSPVGGDAVVAEAKKYLGIPYLWGGTDPKKGLDCSGLVQLVYKNLGYDLPRVSYQQAAAGRPVASMAQAQPGDLIAWDNSSRNNGVDHIAIYIGNGKMIEAPRTGLDVRIIDVPSTPDVIRRILPEGSTVSSVASTGGALPADTPYKNLFESAAAKHGVSAKLLAEVARAESAFNPRAVSHAGAQGLMQLMPSTARGLGVTNSFDPAQAVDGAARLLKSHLQQFGKTELALAAYNAGPGAVSKYNGVPPYSETQNYVRKIMAALGGAA
ncbi:transglycosylase SLT domain-containing protein [Nocardioides caldifontis]|uniref:transglycosylase SLT domain-containing protein n=1 Tax=Nocardioides caldifontis TaxID=2588938 RepID=UPI001EF0FC50|nr:transglycosylase SLT domain-containing protein [Nocardioides caldifontis]